MATVTSETREAFNRSEMAKKTAGMDGVCDALHHIAESTGAKMERAGPHDDDLGHSVTMKHNDAQVQMSVNEFKDKIHLTSIQSKSPKDLTKKAEGTGRGSEAFEALKSYADKTGKKLHVVDATPSGAKFWDKDKSLKRADVEMTLDGNKYIPPISYTYQSKK